MRERIAERKFSGWSLNIPDGLKLTARDVRNGEVLDLNDDLSFWMQQPFKYIIDHFSERG